MDDEMDDKTASRLLNTGARIKQIALKLADFYENDEGDVSVGQEDQRALSLSLFFFGVAAGYFQAAGDDEWFEETKQDAEDVMIKLYGPPPPPAPGVLNGLPRKKRR